MTFKIKAKPELKLKSKGRVVGVLDKPYDLSSYPEGKGVFDEIDVFGRLDGELDYMGTKVKLVSIGQVVGLEVVNSRARGPLFRKVGFEVRKPA